MTKALFRTLFPGQKYTQTLFTFGFNNVLFSLKWKIAHICALCHDYLDMSQNQYKVESG